MEDKTAIREALDLLRTPRKHSVHSWTKRTFKSEAGGFCILGALSEVRTAHNISPESYRRDHHAIEEVIMEHFPTKKAQRFGADIPSFNDYPRRNFGEIEQVLEKAAVFREEEGAMSYLDSPKV